jgi:hypothetical protein
MPILIIFLLLVFVLFIALFLSLFEPRSFLTSLEVSSAFEPSHVSADLWSMGCIMAELMNYKQALFPTNIDGSFDHSTFFLRFDLHVVHITPLLYLCTCIWSTKM